MPNWCQNSLSVFGAPAQLAAFYARIRSSYIRSAITRRRSPQGRHASLGFLAHVIGREYGQVAMNDLPTRRHQDTHTRQLVLSHGYLLSENVVAEWTAEGRNVACMFPEGSPLLYVFRSAWAPPRRWLMETAAAWADLTFALSYGEETPSRGRIIRSRGGIVYDAHETVEEAGLPEFDTVPEGEGPAWLALAKRWSEWEQDYVEGHLAWATSGALAETANRSL